MKLSDRIASVPPSLTLAITAKAKSLKAQGVDVVSFGAGEPDFDTPQCIKDKAITAIESGFTKYTPASGIPDLKKAVVKKFAKENNLTYAENEVVISCGAKHSLYNIFQVLCNAEDEVIIPAPFWLSYPEMVKLAGAKPIEVKTNASTDYKMTADMFKAAITEKTKALVLNSPSNPTGAVYTEEELRAIAKIAVEKNIIVVSDEIYEHLIYGGKKHVSIASLGDDIKKQTLIVNGVSKSYSMTGWRIGYIAGNADVIKAIGTLQSHSTSNPTSFAQVGAVAALECANDAVGEMLVSFERRRELILNELSSIKKIAAFKPNGAFYVFCDISKSGLSAMDFATRLLDEKNVAVIPSEPFGIGSHIRLSFAISDEAIKKGVGRIKKWVEGL